MSQPLLAADFTISNGQIETTSQTLNANETGTIEAGGQLNTSTATAITANAINNTVTNNGSITTTGGTRAYGIRSFGANTIITNSGSMMTTGDAAAGIRSCQYHHQ